MKRKSMKKLSLFAFAFAAALMMTGCSDEDGAIAETGTSTSSSGEGYMSVAINLPSTTSTRASVDGYDDGTEDEYTVKNATLYIFGGDDEATATLQATYTLGTGFELESGNEQITSNLTALIETTAMSGAYYYPIVILNANGQMPTLTIGSSKISDLNATAYSTTAAKMIANGFFMSNSPYSSVAGGTTSVTSEPTITTCPSFDESKIFKTADEAKANPAATIYVERAVAKVTVTEGNSISVDNDKLASIKIDGWLLDNTNNYTYLVRNVDCDPSWWTYKSTKTGAEFRFIDGAAFETGVSAYRTHFGIDPNYDVAYDASNFTQDVTNTSTYGDLGSSNPQYCLENTFDVDHMTEQNTTRVVLKTTLTLDGESTAKDFYTINNNSEIYDEDKVKGYVANLAQAWIADNIDTYVKGGSILGTDITVTLNSPDNGGTATITAITVNGDNVDVWQDNQNLNALQTAVTALISGYNTNYTISYYKDGVAYYSVLVKHFGDSDTPWDESEMVGSDAYAAPSGTTAENQWLGRYGMLRNTWYSIEVTGVKNLGSASVPDVTTDWDDNADEYIAVEINVLPWALRTQSVTL